MVSGKVLALLATVALALAGIGLETRAAGEADGVVAPAPAPVVLSLPRDIDGPYIADTQILEALDARDAGGDCAKSGKFVFGCLIQGRLAPADRRRAIGNPFTLDIATQIPKTIETDLAEFRATQGVTSTEQINTRFLDDPHSRLELVGIINRVDRRFVEDTLLGSAGDTKCGEISLIYRFSYAVYGTILGKPPISASRLPVTMNIVFPALSASQFAKGVTCRQVAARWLGIMRLLDSTSSLSTADKLSAINDPRSGIVSLIDGADIGRIELNIQAFRKPASTNEGMFGSTAAYVLRVFRWDGTRFIPSYLSNQIDRARFLGSKGDGNSCNPDAIRPAIKDKFIAWLKQDGGAAIRDIDYGTLDIPREYLACRAVSVSPGGEARSGNSPFWGIFTNGEVQSFIAAGNSARMKMIFIDSVDDFRMRLNEQSCTGCHQTRAIAGFHFPGQDRGDTMPANAVLLPGSPHFYGDQIRRRTLLERIARSGAVKRYDLRTGFAARPMNAFSPQLASTQLIGGWGAACIMPDQIKKNRRQWGCREDEGLSCRQVYASDNTPGLGVCLPKKGAQIGDPLQFGQVKTGHFGSDAYARVPPLDNVNDPRISVASLGALPNNSYFGAHQEYYHGVGKWLSQDAPKATTLAEFIEKRDAGTGGFPGGMLRLSECRDLPPEATCGLTASSGFNECIAAVSGGSKTLDDCFTERTSYAGMRACDVANPCRDDYICLKPMGYNQENGDRKFDDREARVSKIYDPRDFGQSRPDSAWLKRNDRRGICIPPYFVFQFRADGHPRPRP